MVVVHDEDGKGLGAVDAARFEALFRREGWIVLRGFDPTPADFDAFARRFTATHFLGYGRAPFAEHPAITMANESQLPLEPHCDNGLRPEDQRPDVTWFFCATPAAEGGETTFFDGVRVWNALSADTRRLLTERKLCFVSRYAWRQLRLPDRATFERFVAAQGGTIRTVHADDSADVEILAPAVRRTRWGGELAFTSSLCVAGSKGFEAMRVTLEGEPALPPTLRAEIDAALAACCEELRWEPGDIAALDNTRFLHGRRGFTDPARRLYLIQTLRATF